MNSKSPSLKTREYVLIACSMLLTCSSISCLFGVYWLFAGGRFAYEGGYFIGFAVYFSRLFIPFAFYFYLWPKPSINQSIKVICSVPFFIMLMFNIYWAWEQYSN